MIHFREDSRKIATAGLILVGIAMFVTGEVYSPFSIDENLSPDGIFGGGVLGKPAIAEMIHWGAILLGALLILFGILKIIGSRYARKIECAAEELAPRMTQPRTLVIIVFLLLALLLLNKTLDIAAHENKWKSVTGFEYYWIAEGLAGGHGYSLAANHRWYFDDFKSEYPADKYYPTALEEPVYPFLLAFAMKNFGAYGRLAILLLQVAALYVTAIMIYLLIRKIFDSRWGIIASTALLTTWWYEVSWLTTGAFSPAVLGGLNITGSAYLLLWSLENVSVKRGVILGLMLAFSCLTLSAGMLFVPLAMLFTLIFKRPMRPFAWGPALAIAVTVGVVLLPWAMRNYSVFGEFIPIRTGFGLALHQSNPALAATFSTGTQPHAKELGPVWHAKNAKDAIEQVRRVNAKRMAMYKISYDLIELEAPGNYPDFNEAQRDKVYLGKSIDFIKSNPEIFLELTRYRIQSFLVGWSPRHTLVTLLAFVGGLLAWRNKKVFILATLVAAYIFPFSLAGSWMYRYRYPIEPLLFVLACGIPVIFFSKMKSAFGKLNFQ